MYVAKDYLMICDRCGGQYRKSGMREEWTGLWVCTRGCWESRHPQDFVTGVDDDTTVPVSRPTVQQTMGESSLLNTMLIWTTGALIVPVTSLSQYDPIGIVMDNGATHWSFIESDPTDITGTPLTDANGELVLDANGEIIYTADAYSGQVIVLNSPVSYLCSSGNTVYLPSINSENWET